MYRMQTRHKIVIQKFTKNRPTGISYMIHTFPCHRIYSHVLTVVQL